MLPNRKLWIISGRGLAAAALALGALGAAPAHAAATLATLYSFCAQNGVHSICTDGATPLAGLIADPATGNLFGTTFGGGATGQGTVFELAKTASGYAESVLYSFCAQGGSCTDGANPVAGLIADPATGNLFGTTVEGGANAGGRVFELAKTASGYAESVLYSFCAQTNCIDGANPRAGLIADPATGNLFGTTVAGGAHNLGGGTVFELKKTASGYAESVLYSFCAQTNCTDGAGPEAGLIADPATGDLFGTTMNGGANGQGTVFELAKTTNGYAETVLYSFCAQGGASCTDGESPVVGLLADAAGNLFGTTTAGGANGQGTVFELAKTASGYAETVLYSFCAQGGASCTDGATPGAGLIADPATGDLFGTTAVGGAHNTVGGTVFELGASGFVPFAGTPGTKNCQGKSASAFARQYGGLSAAAAALGYSSVPVLQNVITAFCAGYY